MLVYIAYTYNSLLYTFRVAYVKLTAFLNYENENVHFVLHLYWQYNISDIYRAYREIGIKCFPTGDNKGDNKLIYAVLVE